MLAVSEKCAKNYALELEINFSFLNIFTKNPSK